MTDDYNGYDFELLPGENPLFQWINMQPGIADFLYANESARIEQLEKTYKTTIIPVAREGYHREHYEIVRSPEHER